MLEKIVFLIFLKIFQIVKLPNDQGCKYIQMNQSNDKKIPFTRWLNK